MANPSSDHEYPDALPGGLVRGRGAGLNPGNRYETVRLHVLGEHLDELAAQRQAEGQSGKVSLPTQVIPDHSRTIINHVVNSPDIGFSWSINPYRGCEHGCSYCYARPTHEQLGFSSGLDFETRILAKFDAAQLLTRELAHPSWRGETIMMSGVTDCYQPLEEKLRITRSCLEVMAHCRQPVSMVTKNRLILRDLDLLAELARFDAVHVAISLTTLDNHLAAKMEPRASSPRDRLAAIAGLSAAGVPVTVMVAPTIPAVTDREMPAILAAAADAGACSAGYVLLRLPYQVKDLFLDFLRRELPERAGHVETLIRDTREGLLYDSRFGSRQRGVGPVAQQIQQMFAVFKRKHQLDQAHKPLDSSHFRRPQLGGQLDLFP